MGCPQQGSEDVKWLKISPRPFSMTCGVRVCETFKITGTKKRNFNNGCQLPWEKKKSFLSLHVSTYGATTGCSLWVPTTQLARCSSPLWPLPLHGGWEENLARVLFQISLSHHGNAHSRVFMLSNLTCPGHLCPYLSCPWPTFWGPPLIAEGLMKFYSWIEQKIWARHEQKRLTQFRKAVE